MRFFRFIPAVAAAAFAFCGSTSAGAAAAAGMDVVIVAEMSALGALWDGEDSQPWFSCPCLNGDHFYLAPAAVSAEEEAMGVTFPAAAAAGEAGEGQLSAYDAALGRKVLLDAEKEYRFRESFLLSEEARGFESWKYHFVRGGDGVPLRIDVSAENGCFGRETVSRALAAAIAEAVLSEGGGNRVAVVPCGAAGDSRWRTPLTDEIELLFAAIDAAPAEGGGDAAAGLAAALRLLNRRPLLERVERPAAVLLLTGGDIFPPAVWERCGTLVRMLEAPRDEAERPPFGVFLPESLSKGAGTAVYAVGVLTQGGDFFDLLCAAGADAAFVSDKEKAEAFASATVEKLYGECVMRCRYPA
ncbi:MAG: hypothetical protein E7330_02775 [Clostridiales bacterium]|nr:hypothetical protein [Clostridiales bacterium]